MEQNLEGFEAEAINFYRLNVLILIYSNNQQHFRYFYWGRLLVPSLKLVLRIGYTPETIIGVTRCLKA